MGALDVSLKGRRAQVMALVGDAKPPSMEGYPITPGVVAEVVKHEPRSTVVTLAIPYNNQPGKLLWQMIVDPATGELSFPVGTKPIGQILDWKHEGEATQDASSTPAALAIQQ